MNGDKLALLLGVGTYMYIFLAMSKLNLTGKISPFWNTDLQQQQHRSPRSVMAAPGENCLTTLMLEGTETTIATGGDANAAFEGAGGDGGQDCEGGQDRWTGHGGQ
jgi:hypothetical protein